MLSRYLINLQVLFSLKMFSNSSTSIFKVGVSNVLGWVKRLRVKRVTGEKHVNPNTTRLLNVLNGLTRLSPEPV